MSFYGESKTKANSETNFKQIILLRTCSWPYKQILSDFGICFNSHFLLGTCFMLCNAELQVYKAVLFGKQTKS